MIRTGILKFAAALLAAVFAVGDAEAEGRLAPINPAYLRWKKQRPKGPVVKKERISKVGLLRAVPEQAETTENEVPFSANNGVMPTIVDFSYLNRINRTVVRGIDSPLPIKYDPRPDLVTDVRHQDPNNQGIGTCWAQASIGAIETWLARERCICSLSIRNLVNLCGYKSGHTLQDWKQSSWNGLNHLAASSYFLRWNGPVLESQDPYCDTHGNVRLSYDSPTFNPVCHLQQTRIIPPRNDALDNENLKRAIMEFGGIYATMCLHAYTTDSRYYGYYAWNPCVNGAYYADYPATGHAVTLVGWDDAYPKENFNQLMRPAGNGAFIVKDSYGNDIYRDSGYIYVSYYDASFAYTEGCAFPALEPVDNYASVYQYDEFGWVGSYSPSSTATTGSGSNIFVANEKEVVAAVGFYATVQNEAYTIRVYKDCLPSSPESGTKMCEQSGLTGDYAGFYTVPLKLPVAIDAGERFSVVIDLNARGTVKDDDVYLFALEYEVEGYSDGATSSTGQSFFKFGGEWYDMAKELNPSVNFCCKAYTKSITASKPTLASIAISGAPSLISGKSWQFTSTAKYSNNSEEDVTDKTTWSIAEGRNYASISSTGLVTAKEVTEQQTVRVHAKYTEDGVSKEDDWSFYVTVAAPQPPTDLAATEGTDASCIRVNWTAPSGASEYSIYRSPTDQSKNAIFVGGGVTATRYSDTDKDVVSGVDYWYFVKAKNASGTSGYSAGVKGWRKLAAPENVSATDGASLDNVTVTWSEVRGASHYRVYRSEDLDETPIAIGSWQSERKFVDNRAKPGVSYYYYVAAAVDAEGNRPSDQSIFDDGFRAVPVTLDFITITGESSISSGGNATYTCTATYTDKSDKPVSATWEVVSGGDYVTLSGATLTAKAVTANETVVLMATYTDGVTRTATKTITITAVKPSAPSSVRLKSATAEAVTIGWATVANAASYSVWRGTSTSDRKRIAGTLTVNEYVDRSGDPGVTYTYWVKASNAAGESDFSTVSASGTRTLSAPTGVSASDGTYTDKTVVSWKPVAGATHYRVARAETATGAKTELGGWLTATTYEDKGGTAGKRYWYFVKAATSSAGANASAYGTGDEGWRKVAVTLVSISINGPVKLAAGKSTVLSCDAIYSNGTTNRNVKAEWSASGAGGIDAGGKLTANAVTEDSTVTVTARYTDGTTKSATHTVTIIAPIRATAEVKNVKASARWPFSGKLDVDYELDTKPEGTRAVVTLSGRDDDHDVAMAAKTLSGEGAEGAILAGKHRITWDVAADYPHFHAKSFSVEMSAVPILIAAPSNLTASVGTSTKGVDLVWTAVDEATGYEVWRGTSSSTNTAELIESTEEVAYSDTTAAAGTTYYYWVRSVGEDGKSDFGKPVSGLRAYADITVSFNGNGGTPSYSSKTYSPTKTYDGLPTASRTGYQFAGWYTDSSGGSQVTTSSIVPTAATTLWAHWTANTYTIRFNANGGSGSMGDLPMTYDVAKNLTANAFTLTGYSFIGWATTSGGSVVYTDGYSVKNLTADNGSTVTLFAKWQANIPSAPTGVSATDGQAGSVTVSWSAVSIATSYEIWRNTSSSTSGAEKIGASTTTSFTDTTVPINTTCYYWVKAVNDMGTSGWSSYDSGYCVLGVPANVSASDNTLAVGIRITWDAVDGADSYAIYRGTSSSIGSATQIGTSMGPAYVDSEVATGTTYYYFIKAVASGLGVTSAFSAYDTGSRKAGEPLYVVVDLSGGTTAANYPISELSAAPSGGWTDEYKTNKLVLRRIPNGTYTMGSPSGEIGRWSFYEDLHSVTISKPFYASVFETTQKQYERVMGAKPSYFSNASCYATRPVEKVSYDMIRGRSEGAKWPTANTVDSSSFMGRIRARTGLIFDLPTEAQWEYVCRAGTVAALNSGKNIVSESSDINMNDVGRYFYNFPCGSTIYSSDSDTSSGTVAVGSYKANSWGLYDMHGNVWEWCLDWDSMSLGTVPTTDPKGALSGFGRMIRGGGWDSSSRECRSASRPYRACDCGPAFGFRLCCPAGLMLTPPTGVSATDGTSAMGVTVMWNSVSGATSYNIWRGVHNASGAAEKIGTVTGTSYTDSSVEAGKQYWYWIEAVNSSYSSGFTAWDTGYRKLGSPSGVSATAGTGANNLTWSAVADATSYKILRGTSSTYSSATQIGTVTTATYSDATALPGQGYYYWVVAVNDQGESAPSSYVYTSGWQLAAPTGVSASDGTYYDKVVVSWGAVTGASAYYIYRYTSNSSGSASQIGSSTTTSYEDKTAVAGTTYYYWVKAYNADSKGYSAFSAVDSGVRAIKAPTNVTASDNTLAVGIRIVWDAVNEADSYVIYRGTSSSSGSATQIGTSMGPAYIDSEVSSGTTYYYFIKAIASDLGVTSAFSAYDTGSRKAGEPLYVVVDLSDGTTAASYPISELSAIPSGGWSDEYKTNKLVLRSISSGTFTMGGHATDYPGACDINVHSVTISKPFYMGVFEVTQKQYELVMGTRPSVFANESCYMTRPVEAVSYDMLRGSSEGAKWPSANTVDSTSFMGKIRSRTGLPFDLPTEAQWEYACRAGTTTALNCGKNLKADNYDVNLKQLGRYLSSYGWNSDLTEGTAAVGSYLANAWGLYDMHGNVHEWCLDWYQSSLGAGAVTDPKGATSGLGRVMRGGCIIDYAKACISAARSGVESNYPCLDCFFGFRLCCPAGEATDQVTVSFNANGGTGIMSAASVGNGGSMVVPECTFYKSGCVFAGWATSFSGGVVYEAGATIPGVTSALTLYAKWVTPSKTYLVVDLAAGSDAAGYPMSEMSAEPNGGWADEYKTNKLVLRRIANGAYLMGGASTEIGYLGDEAKQHQVTITKPFYMGVFEVTQKQYELVMGSNPSAYKGDARPVECVSYNTIRGSSDGAMWPSANAVDSTSFMGKIRARTGLTFDLPTEAQWEYACRAGTTTALNSGKNLTSTGGDSNMEEVGRYYYSTDRTYDEYSQHAVVGSYLPNNWGLYDMHGNVWECCLDWYVSRGTSGFDFEAVSDPKGAASGSRRVIRGGGWSYYARYCRSAYRASRDPSNENNDLGFRLCCPAE